MDTIITQLAQIKESLISTITTRDIPAAELQLVLDKLEAVTENDSPEKLASQLKEAVAQSPALCMQAYDTLLESLVSKLSTADYDKAIKEKPSPNGLLPDVYNEYVTEIAKAIRKKTGKKK